MFTDFLQKTLIVWRRLGKEHGENSGFKVNADATVDSHIREKVESFRATAPGDWRWWRVSGDLLVERPLITLDSKTFTEKTLIYYLPQDDWVIMQNVVLRMYGTESWYIHIGDISRDPDYDCWIFTDLFADVVVAGNRRDHTVLDLDELAKAYDLGLVDERTVCRVLRSTQAAVDLVSRGEFPPKEVRDIAARIEEREEKK